MLEGYPTALIIYVCVHDGYFMDGPSLRLLQDPHGARNQACCGNLCKVNKVISVCEQYVAKREASP